MTKKQIPVCVGAWYVVVVATLGGCHVVKSCDAEFVLSPQRVSIEEYTSRQLLEISSMAVQVAAETGGELTVMGLSYVQVRGSGDIQGCRVASYTTAAPSTSLGQPKKLVIENKPDRAVAVQVDKENDRDVTRGTRPIDNYSGLAEFKFSGDSTAVRLRSVCLPTDKPPDDPGQFVLSSVEEAFPGVRVTAGDNTNPDLHPLPTLTLGVHVAPQFGAQSGAQSGE